MMPKNMKITLSGSMRHKEIIEQTLIALEKLGAEGLFPNLHYSDETGDRAKNTDEKIFLARAHFDAIDKADIVYFLTPSGYMGTSCKIELGYALRARKSIYFSDRTNDIGLDGFAIDFIPTDQLHRLLD